MKNKTKNSIIVLSVVMILILVFVVYLKLDQNKDIAYIIETKKNNFLVSEKIHSAYGLKNKSAEIEGVRKGLDDFYIDRNNMLGFIESLEEIAKNNQVDLVIDSVAVDESHLKESMPYGVLNMTLTANAKDFSSAVNFLANLEKLPFSIDFINTKLVGVVNEKNESPSSWKISINIKGITN